MWIISWRLDIEKKGLDFNQATTGLIKLATVTTHDSETFEETFKAISLARLDYEVSEYRIKEKKQKYIRQQHKLAQRHYRRRLK